RRRRPLPRPLKGGRIGEHGVHVLGDGKRGAATVGDQATARSPFDLASRLVAREARETGAIEQLHFRRSREHQREGADEPEADERDAQPHPAARMPTRAAPWLSHRISYLDATMEALDRSAPPTSTITRSGGGGPMPR